MILFLLVSFHLMYHYSSRRQNLKVSISICVSIAIYTIFDLIINKGHLSRGMQLIKRAYGTDITPEEGQISPEEFEEEVAKLHPKRAIIFIFEVEKITEHPLEFDGRDALTFFYVPDSIVVLPRLKNFVRNVIVFPVLKKIIYATHKIGFFRA